MVDDELKAMFKDVPVEPDTRLLRLSYGHLDGIPVRLERWSWEGVKGHSAVFRAEDVQGYDDSRLSMLVTGDPNAPKNVTITRNEPFVIVSFGFRG